MESSGEDWHQNKGNLEIHNRGRYIYIILEAQKRELSILFRSLGELHRGGD